MTAFSFFKYFDAFELDVNVVNFVYYEKTRMFKSFIICPGLFAAMLDNLKEY